MGWQIVEMGFNTDEKRGRVFKLSAHIPNGTPPARVEITLDWPDGADAPPGAIVHNDMSKALDVAALTLGSLAGRIQNQW